MLVAAIRHQVKRQARQQVRQRAKHQAEHQVEHQVKHQVEQQVKHHLKHHLKRQTNHQTKSQYHSPCASCRRLHTHAGPIESRRRLGKRHMTGLMPASSAYPPIWQFDAPPASGMPQWEPPTTPSYRRQRNKRLSASRLFNSFIDWLDNSNAHEPFVPDPADLTPTDAMPIDAVPTDTVPADADIADAVPADTVPTDAVSIDAASAPDLPLEATAQVPRESALDSQLPQEIARLRMQICQSDMVDDLSLFQLSRTCRNSLRRRVKNGSLTVSSLRVAFEPLDLETKGKIPAEWAAAAEKIASQIRRTLLSAMTYVQRQSDDVISQDMWLAFADKVCGGGGTNHGIQLFWLLMRAMPASLRVKIPSGKVTELARTVVEAQAARHHLFPHWLDRAARFGNALQKLAAVQRQPIDDAIHEFVLRPEWDAETARRMQFAWLVVKAYDAQATTQDFVAAYGTVVEPESHLTSLHVWMLLTARLTATGALQGEAIRTYMNAEYTSTTQRWTQLVLTLMASKTRDEGLSELCACLGGIAKFTALARALACLPLDEMHMDAIQAVAEASNDHMQAIVLHEYMSANGASWEWTTWAKHVESMIKDARLKPLYVWKVLRLIRRADQAAGAEASTAAEAQAKMQLLDRMGRWYVEAQHLTGRQMLRNVQRCVDAQRKLAERLSPQMVVNVAEAVTHDLKKGETGRHTRLEWLLDIVARTHGVEKAQSVAKTLRGWQCMTTRGRGL